MRVIVSMNALKNGARCGTSDTLRGVQLGIARRERSGKDADRGVGRHPVAAHPDLGPAIGVERSAVGAARIEAKHPLPARRRVPPAAAPFGPDEGAVAARLVGHDLEPGVAAARVGDVQVLGRLQVALVAVGPVARFADPVREDEELRHATALGLIRPAILERHRAHSPAMKHVHILGLVGACCLIVAGCASSGDCSSPYASSPQFKGCLFANPPNPQTPPGASTWKIWSRFLVGSQGRHGAGRPDPGAPADARPSSRRWTRRPTTSCGSAIRRTCSSCAASSG